MESDATRRKPAAGPAPLPTGAAPAPTPRAPARRPWGWRRGQVQARLQREQL